MADKKITELPIASAISAGDVSVLVASGTDYQFSFTTLLAFVAANLSVGAKISFGAAIPQNTTGSNGDVFIKTDTAVIYQKINGIWALAYNIPAGGGRDGTLLYGHGVPGSITGNDDDSYIDTTTGIFYLKASGAWAQAFSMATGPQGPQGTAGTNGTNGTNGNSVLNGLTNPSNSLGSDGDFYINTSTFYLFGPKAAGVWPDGASVIGPTGPAGPAFNMTSFIQAAPIYNTEAEALAGGLAAYSLYRTAAGGLRYKLSATELEFTYTLPLILA